MNDKPHPFRTIEGTQEFIALLEEAIVEAMHDVEQDLQSATMTGNARRTEALQLALYKLGQLENHACRSRRLLNDLRTLRRLLFAEREHTSDVTTQLNP